MAMIALIIRKIALQLLTLGALLLVILAVYVSLGKLLIPLVSDYRIEIEQQLSQSLAMTVRVADVQGGWNRLNPALSLQRVQVMVPAWPEAVTESGGAAMQTAAEVESITLELNVLDSLRQWRLVLETVNIDGLGFEFIEQSGGCWQLAGVNSRSSTSMSTAQIFDLASRFGNLELTQTRLNFHYLSGESHYLHKGQVQFQSRGEQYFLHLDAYLGESAEPVSVSAELQGNRLAELSGAVYLMLPADNYSSMLADQGIPRLRAEAVTGSAELWAELASGQLTLLQAELNFPELAVTLGSETGVDTNVQIEQLSASIAASRSSAESGWNVVMQDVEFNWQQMQWPQTDLSLLYQDENSLEMQMDTLNVGMLSALLQIIDVMPAGVQQALAGFNPKGVLDNLDIRSTLRDGQLESMSLSSNLRGVNVDAYVGSPAMWGLKGYTELSYQATEQRLNGFAEIDSDEVMLHLPGLFIDPWSYRRVNGRVAYNIDMTEQLSWRLASSVIVAESEIIKGRARFAIDFNEVMNAEPTLTLDLLVGVLQADVSYKHAYLPMAEQAPEAIRNVMKWVDAAVKGGEGGNSGLIYRGSIRPGTTPVAKTLQMYYQVEDGELQYDPQWPILENLSGVVSINDGSVDVNVSSGESLGINFGSTTAYVRRNSEGAGSWLTVTGSGQGAAAQGLDYLQQTPVTRGFGAVISDWVAQGDIGLDLQLSIPLFIAGGQPQVSAQLLLRGNTLDIPGIDVQFTDINGRLYYQQDSGLRSEDLSARLFGDVVIADLRSDGLNSELPLTVIDLTGNAKIADLMSWPRHTAVSSALLERGSGELAYTARYELPHQRDSTTSSTFGRFTLQSDLEAVALSFPAPFNKETGSPLPLTLDMEFLENGSRVRSTVKDIINADLRLRAGAGVERGLILLGPRDDSLPVRRFNASAPGVEVLGSLKQINYDHWNEVIRETLASETVGTSALKKLATLADVQVEELIIFEQPISNIDLQLSTQTDSLLLEIDSDFVRGSLKFPDDPAAYIDVQFDHLRVPGEERELEPDAEQIGRLDTGNETGSAEEAVEFEEPAIDPFAAVDPRTFPRLRINATEVSIGDADYGQWQLLVDPTDDGAHISDLIVSSRGLQIGQPGREADFNWRYDGQNHESQLQAVVEAGNLAAVLSAFGYAPSLESNNAVFTTDLSWSGSPGNFSAVGLNGAIDLKINSGRFLQSGGAGSGALKLISILNFDALVRRLRFSDDLARSGLAYDEIIGNIKLSEGTVNIVDRLQIIGPSSLFQIEGSLDLREETIDGSMYITLPVSDNIPWLGGLAALNNLINWQVAVGVFIFDRIFGDQVDSLTSAQYLLQGPWDNLEPRLNQVFTAGGSRTDAGADANSSIDSGAVSPDVPISDAPISDGQSVPIPTEQGC